ncbi:hypothetical protein Q1695_006488 [Nippostrongylus brasiliensis]|nr:hypothetical protein Q1695_006488 [Nippostrongylus brasiliensis]
MNIWLICSARLSLAVAVLSILTNLLLIFAYFKCPTKSLGSYKLMFLVMAVFDLFYSLLLGTFCPIFATNKHVLVGISTGLYYQRVAGYIALASFFVSLLVAFILVANNFGYRYLLLCRRPHIYIYQTTRGRLMLTSVNTFVTVFWTYFALVIMRSDAKLTEMLESFVRTEMELDIWDHGHTALALEDLISSPMKLVVCSGILTTYMMLMISIGYCTNRILHMLKNSAMSIALKRLHRQMLVLLLLQLLNPLISMYGPVIIFVIFLVNNFTTPVALSAVMCALYSIFPLVNPIVMLYFVTDYRAFIVKRLTRTKSDNVWSNSWNMKASDNKARPAFS